MTDTGKGALIFMVGVFLGLIFAIGQHLASIADSLKVLSGR